MESETVSASITIKAPAEAVFAVLIDPAKHAAIDGTGWVRDPLGRQPLTAPRQIFRMAMYHANHPNGDYEMANRVEVFNPPHAISWKPGHDARRRQSPLRRLDLALRPGSARVFVPMQVHPLLRGTKRRDTEVKLTIFAATGGIGRQLLEQAVAAGHDVTAVVRNRQSLPSTPARVVIADLAAADPAALQPAVSGADAVLSGLGARTKADAGVA